MRFKRLLALLLAAALALSLLAGCGGGKNQSLSQMLLNLLDGQYQNVSVEIDSDLEAKLRQAISESETDEELRAALEQLLGGGISFQRLGSGQQGDSAWTLIIYPGTDPDAAARSVYLDLDKVFAALPDDGVYSSGFAMVEMENGYAILVRATVDKAGTEDKPDPVTLKSIEVTAASKTYYRGDAFNKSDLTVTAAYSNGTTNTLKTEEYTLTIGGQSVTDSYTFTSSGDQTFTIEYDGKTATISVTVKEPEVEKIEVTQQPNKTTYTAGDTFSPNGMVITATYKNGLQEKVNIKDCTFSIGSAPVDESYQFTTAGSYTLTVNYKGGKATVNITVNQAALDSIQATGLSKTEYKVGETFSSDGLRVTASDNYNNVQTISASEYTLTITAPDRTSGNAADYKFAAEGKHTLKVSYNNMEATVEITVNPATMTGIEVTHAPTKTTYISGEPFDPTGMVVTVHYSDGSTKKIENITSSGNQSVTWSPATITDNPTTVTITYGGKPTTVEVTVLDTKDSYQNGTYSIATADGLEFVADLVNGGKTDIDITLTGNIDLTGEWTPIGADYNNAYTGIFDGNGKTITGLTFNQSKTSNVGLIGYLGSGGKVQNLTLENVNLNGNLYVGGVVGYSNNGTVTACTVSGSINGKDYVGGIVGSNYLGTVTACYNTSSTVNGSYLVGGVVGQNNNGIVTACYNASGSIYGEVTVGGVVGNNNTGIVTACYNASGSIHGEVTVGGVVGNNTGTVTACYWSGSPDNDNGGATKVDGTTVTWQTAVAAMNAALSGKGWQYELTGELPTLKKQ